MKKINRLAVSLFALVLVGALWSAFGSRGTVGEMAVADAGSGGCTLAKTKFKSASGPRSTTSGSLVPVPEMQMTFTVSGSGPTCLEVFFAATSHKGTGEGTLVIMPILDEGTNEAQPRGCCVAFTYDSDATSSQSFHWVFEDVAPGSHTLKMVWASATGGTPVFMDMRSMIVHYP